MLSPLFLLIIQTAVSAITTGAPSSASATATTATTTAPKRALGVIPRATGAKPVLSRSGSFRAALQRAKAAQQEGAASATTALAASTATDAKDSGVALPSSPATATPSLSPAPPTRANDGSPTPTTRDAHVFFRLPVVSLSTRLTTATVTASATTDTKARALSRSNSIPIASHKAATATLTRSKSLQPGQGIDEEEYLSGQAMNTPWTNTSPEPPARTAAQGVPEAWPDTSHHPTPPSVSTMASTGIQPSPAPQQYQQQRKPAIRARLLGVNGPQLSSLKTLQQQKGSASFTGGWVSTLEWVYIRRTCLV